MTNVAFRPGTSTLVMTESETGSILEADLPTAGAPLYSHYCGWIPASFTTFTQRAFSAFTNAAVSVGVISLDLGALVEEALAHDGIASVAFTAAFIFCTISGGHAFRARSARSRSRPRSPARPSSSIVGTSGTAGLRCLRRKADGAHLARANLRDDRRQRGEVELRLARDDREHRRRSSLVGHVREVGRPSTSRGARPRGAPASPRPRTNRTSGVLSLAAFSCASVVKFVVGEAIMIIGYEHTNAIGDEIVDGIELLLRQARVDRVHRDRRHHERVAVGGRLQHHLGREVARRSRACSR